MADFNHTVFKTKEGNFFGVSQRVIDLGYTPPEGIVEASEEESEKFFDSLKPKPLPTAIQDLTTLDLTDKNVVKKLKKFKLDAEKQAALEAERLETEKQAALEAERQATLEAEQQATLEAERLEALETERLEAEKQAALEAEKQAALEAEKQAALETERKRLPRGNNKPGGII